MNRQTDEADDQLADTFVVDFLQSMLQREVTNTVHRDGNTLLVSLTNQTTASIVAPKVPHTTQPPEQPEAHIHNIATLRYVMQHDYGYGTEHVQQTLNKLELRNLDECRTYIEDAISSQLNAYFTNYLIEFMNGEKYLLAVELKQ